MEYLRSHRILKWLLPSQPPSSVNSVSAFLLAIYAVVQVRCGLVFLSETVSKAC
ncbi:hypothetical protein SAMN04488002_0185 [Litoreibacter janthinus]|uniref:Uncharacterized protein n=1 Tax=Litoreibacter janthinus TaxID=670154 RepID=A0A1I6FS12_9RHOB|nr:hypothetical protein SAMN04488002_0185 [Litoreibacter janthinus]